MITPRTWISRNSLAGLVAALFLAGCGGTRRAPTQAATAPKTETTASTSLGPSPDTTFLSSEIASEAAEYIRLGRESLHDSEWFNAQEYFDSAMVHLAELDSAAALSPGMQAAAGAYRDSVQTWLVEAVTQAGRLGEAEDFTDLFDREIQEVPDSALKQLGPALEGLSGRDFDLPLPDPIPPRVLQAVQVFTGHGRAYFARWLQRKSRYEAMITARLAERNMPKDLLYLAMVESGFNPKAWSHAAASGLWQFISATGRRYGLKQDWWMDARRDPGQATEAALDYLEDLYAEFGDWHLAMAAYNCGEGRIRKERERSPGQGYWDLNLPAETRFYVPKILAAMIIGHHPESFGFQLKPEPPLRFDTATVRHCMALKSVAQTVGISEDSLKTLNPSLRRWCTPPGRDAFVLCLPAGSRERFLANYDKIDTAALVSWRRHKVGRGENLIGLAGRYGVSIAAIQAANGLKGTFLKLGQSLIIPAREGMGKEDDEEEEAPARRKPAVAARYKVQRGETLYDLARRFQVSVRALREANGMSNAAVLNAGKTLNIPQRKAPSDVREEARAAAAAALPHGSRKVYVVRKGESLYSISRALKVKQDDLRRWNGLRGTSVQLGQKLVYQPTEPSKAKAPKTESAPQPAVMAATAPALLENEGPRQYYRVKSGDSLWDISVRFGRSLDELRKLNVNLTESLRPGQKIRIR